MPTLAAQWLPAVGILLAAVLVASVPVLPLPLAHKASDESLSASDESPLASGPAELQAGSKMPHQQHNIHSPPYSRASGRQRVPQAESREPLSWGSLGVSGEAIPAPNPSAVTMPTAWIPSSALAAVVPGSQDSGSASSGVGHVTRSLTFRVTHGFPALESPASVSHQQLRGYLCHQLQSIFHLDFPTFKGIGVLVFGPGPADVTATLVFGGQLGPSAHQVLWTLYREVKASRWMLGSLSLAEDSLASDGFNLTDLSLETISLHFTILTPFLPQLLLPRSEPFVLLEQQILQQLTPLVSGFYKKQLQERPLVLFGNVDQWVSVDLEYKFHSPVPAHLRGLANHLARSSTDLALLKSSLEANGEKAKLELYELWLLIQGGPFTKALQNKTSLEFQKLQLQLTEWLTPGLRPLRNFAQVVVQEFWPEPLTANVGVIFFTPAPARALVWESVHRVLQCPAEVEGLWVEVTGPDHGAASSTASSLPGPGVPSSTFRVLHAVVILILAKELK